MCALVDAQEDWPKTLKWYALPSWDFHVVVQNPRVKAWEEGRAVRGVSDASWFSRPPAAPRFLLW